MLSSFVRLRGAFRAFSIICQPNCQPVRDDRFQPQKEPRYGVRMSRLQRGRPRKEMGGEHKYSLRPLSSRHPENCNRNLKLLQRSNQLPGFHNDRLRSMGSRR
jgi:hypothetical protein